MKSKPLSRYLYLFLDPFGGAKLRPLGRCVKRRSELALSEVEGVNPEQAQAFMLGSRRVDFLFPSHNN